MSKKKKVIVFIIILIIVITLIGLYFAMFLSKPGNIFKKTQKGCDGVGYGYKGQCYGNLAVEAENILLCDQMNRTESTKESFEFNKNMCKKYFKEIIDTKKNRLK
jgi:flagellar basal body-associated protein FliL